jgi:uncharacterized membrane protein SirB2
VETLKTIHVTCVLLSFTGFFIRGVWMIAESSKLQLSLVKIAPHIVDTLLLASALVLAFQMQLSPLQQPWLMTKIIALLIYIGIGSVALKAGRPKRQKISAWLLGLVMFAFIGSVALTKSSLGWFALM